jgi:ABC-2 type transport system permease protein
MRLVVTQATMLRRNTMFWLSSILMAVISMAVFGWLFNPGDAAFKLGIVDEDGTRESQALVQSFEGLENVELRQGARDAQLGALDEGDLAGVLIVPRGFGDDLASSDATLLAYYDDSQPISAGHLTSTVSAVIDGYSDRAAGKRDGVRVNQDAVSTNGGRYIAFLTPGMVGMTIMWVNLGVGLLFVTWREQGILRRLGVTPLRAGNLIVSQASSFALISLTQAVIILSMGRLVFGVEITGSYLWLAVTVALGVIAMLSIGYLIASLVRSVSSVNAVSNAISFPMIFLGGSYFPLEPPPALVPLVNFIPLTHLNNALREVVTRGGDLSDLWLSWAVLAAWAVAGFAVSARTFRWQ